MVCGAVFVLLPGAPQMLGREGERIREGLHRGSFTGIFYFPSQGVEAWVFVLLLFCKLYGCFMHSLECTMYMTITKKIKIRLRERSCPVWHPEVARSPDKVTNRKTYCKTQPLLQRKPPLLSICLWPGGQAVSSSVENENPVDIFLTRIFNTVFPSALMLHAILNPFWKIWKP